MTAVNIPGVDYSFSPPDPACLKANGFQFAMGYIGSGTQDKQLDLAEVQRLHGAGLAVVLLCERGSGSAFAGYDEGVAQAQDCLPDLAALQVPANIPIYFAADRDGVTSDFVAIGEFCRGAASVLGAQRVGMYGEYDLMVYLSQHYAASCHWFFQTYAWSHGQWFAGNHVEQWSNGHDICGGNVDYSRARQSNYGQWAATGSGGMMSMLCKLGDGADPQPRSEVVKALQCVLKYGLGYDLDTDGWYGTATQAVMQAIFPGNSGAAYGPDEWAGIWIKLAEKHAGKDGAPGVPGKPGDPGEPGPPGPGLTPGSAVSLSITGVTVEPA